MRGSKICKIELPKGWEFNIVRAINEIEGIRDIWEKMQSRESFPVIDADIDRYLSVIESSEGKVQPYVIILSDKGNPVGMVIAKIQKHELLIKIGYKTLCRPKLKSLVVAYGGILGIKDDQTCIIIMQFLLQKLQENEVSMIYLDHLNKDSQLYKLSRKMPGVLMRSYFPRSEKHWLMNVPDNIEQFYQSLSPKHRSNLRRFKRRLEKEYSNRYKIVIYSSENDLDESIKAAEKVSRNTYQWGLGCGFKDDCENRILLTTAARKGWLRIPILYIDGEPCAFENWIKYDNKYFGQRIGFDPTWKVWRIGTILFLNTIEYICREDPVEAIDFGFGDAEYKQNYSTTSWDETSIYIFAPYLYPITINILDSSIKAISLFLSNIIHKLGFTEKMKKWWRLRLQYSQDNNR